ncbi:Protein SRT-62 [Aphelenchoides avenae]|nr:Protein SRT-62 [Aphelenchus avenae]
MDANSEGQSSLLLGMIVGAVIFLSSAIFFALNVMAIIAMLRKRESSRSSAYKMMILLSISNCLQMLSQGVSGLFAMSLSEWHPLFNKVLGASLEASYDVYSVFTAILALDRLLRIASPNVEQWVFSTSAMKVWYSIAGLIFLVIFFLLISPLITLTFRIGEFFWGYSYLYENSPVSRIYRTVAELIVVGPFVVAALLHFVIFIVVTYKKVL